MATRRSGGNKSVAASTQVVQKAIAAYQGGRWAQAQQMAHQILAAQPNHFEALHLAGVLAAQSGRIDEAIALLSRAVATNARDAQVHCSLGNALLLGGRPEAALASFNRAIGLRHDFAEAFNNRGNALRALGRGEAALESYDRAVSLASDYAEAHFNRAIVLRELGRPEDVLAACARAIALRSGYPEAHNLHGNALCDLGRPEEALESYERAIALRPGYAEAFNNRGNALRDLGRRTPAQASFLRAIEMDPHLAPAHWNLALVRLQQGDFARGWEGYEWRFKVGRREETGRGVSERRWDGAQNLHGKTILLYGEQGLGDTLQFCRYVAGVAAMGAQRVLLEVQAPLVRLLKDLPGADSVVAAGSALPAFDYHCPLMSLPLAFRTELEGIPAAVPYIHADPALASAWLHSLGTGTRRRIGLVWSGRAGYLKDRERTIGLSDMLPLLPGDAEWISLQKEVRESDAALLAELLASRANLRHAGDRLGDLADTAALIQHLDLVVSVDTSVAHLAGAMGKPVWILLPFNPDWRWMLDREDSPWYPSARLFRQTAIGDWTGVICRVRDELRAAILERS